MTRREASRQLAARFAAAGIENAKAEAEQLACFCFSCSYTELKLHGDAQVPEALLHRLSQLGDERLSGRPLQYVLGTAPFGGLELAVDERVLIPRPETEELLQLAVCEVRRRLDAAGPEGCVRVLDLCTGSGALAAGLAHAFAEDTRVRIAASDLSGDALEVARANCPERVALYAGDLFDALPPGETFDVIVSNPPYIPTGVIESLQPEVRRHEPRLALDGGEDGLDILRRIAKDLPSHLAPGGVLLTEIGDDQGDAARVLFPGCEVRKDLQGQDRMVRYRPDARRM